MNNGSPMSNTWQKCSVSNLGLIVNDYLMLRQQWPMLKTHEQKGSVLQIF